MVNRIDKARMIKGISQEELGNKLGVSQATVSLICNGKLKSIKFCIVKKLSAILDLTIEEIYQSAQGGSNA